MTVKDAILRDYGTVTHERDTHAKARNEFHTKLLERGYFGKRFLDITFSLLGLIPLVMLSPVLFIGIKLSSRGPIFFRQSRTGHKGEAFTCYKVRTMHMYISTRDDQRPALTQKKDPRIFRFGSFLRKSNLDELPQLYNVLKGDMSLVGPRPYMEDECVYWNKKFDDFYYRYSVKPGITGMAQVKGLRGGTFDEDHMRKRLDQDLIYVEKQSIWLDLRIIVGTVLQMLHLKTNAH